MAHRRIGAHRRIRRFSTASLLAAALLSPPFYAQNAVNPDESVETTEEVTEEIVEAVEEQPVDEADRLLEQIKRDNPDLDPAILEQIRQQLENLDIPDVVEPLDKPIEQPDKPQQVDVPQATPDADALIAAEKKRQEAEVLIATLADADEGAISQIERSLAELGEASLVPLKLAALSDDFDLRTRAGAMARRLRWRLVCSEGVLTQHADLPAVMAAEDSKPRREMIDKLIGAPQSDYVPLFVECLADRDQYIRERGIDALVLIGEQFESAAAGKALQQAALNSDDKSVVLLSIAGLGEIEQADIEVLTTIFERTEHAEVQRTILMTAGYTRNAEAVGLIERALKDPRWRVRAAGLEALEDIYRYAESVDLGPILAPLLTDPEPFIRANALRLVAKLKTPGTASTVWKLIEDGSIEEATGLETLATLQDSKAFTEITNRYEAATKAGQHEDAGRWLTQLAEYEERGSVNTLLKTIIKDTSLRKQWTIAIYLASNRNDDTQFVPTVAPLLLDNDPDVRSAVWGNFGRYTMRDYALPTDLDRGLAAGDTEQRIWRLRLIYQKIDINTDTALYNVLADDDPAVVNLALAMLGDLLVNDSFGEDDLPYRNDSDEYIYDDLGNHIPKTPTKPAVNEVSAKLVQSALDYKDPLARVRAASLLYVLEKDRGDKVTQLLKDAIRSGSPGRMAAGFLAAKSEHGDLIEGVDLIEIAEANRGDEYLLTHLCSIMLQVGEKQLVDMALAISADFDLYSHQDYFAGLAGSGAEPAIELVKSKLLDEGGYYAREIIKDLVATSPDAAIEIGSALLESSKLDSYDRQDILRNLVRTKSEKLVPLLKAQIKAALASTDDFERHQARQYQQLLLSIDPESARKEIIGGLDEGDAAKQRQAIMTLIQINDPSDEIVDLVLKTVLEREEEVDSSWSMLVGWLKQRDKLAPLEEAIDQMPEPVQSALLSEMATDLQPDDLKKLLAIKPAGSAVRNRVTWMVAELTTKYPETRPASFDDLDPSMRVYLLSAAGQWDGGPELLGNWLDHQDPATAQAALRGLAIACILNSDTALKASDAERLTAGVASTDEQTAYLSAEALYQRERERLLAIDATKVQSNLALLRIGCAGGGKEKGPVYEAIRAALRNNDDTQSTKARLALIAAIHSERRPTFLRAWQMGQYQYGQQDLLPEALDAFESLDLLYQGVYNGSITADDEAAVAFIESELTKPNGLSHMYLGLFLSQGMIQSAPLDQLDKYLKGLSHWSSQGGETMAIDDMIRVFGGDVAAFKAELIKIMRSDSKQALDAARMAYQLGVQNDEALALIKEDLAKIDPNRIEQRGASSQIYSGVWAIGHAGGEANTRFLIDISQKLNAHDGWQAPSLGEYILGVALTMEPELVREHYLAQKDKGEEAVSVFLDGDPFSIVELLNAGTIDGQDSQDELIRAGRTYYGKHLQDIKAGNKPGGPVASPPWDYYANMETYTEMSRGEFAKFDRDLSFTWIKAGKVDADQSNQFSSGIYDFQENVWRAHLPGYEQAQLYAENFYYDASSLLLSDVDQVAPANFNAALGSMFSTVPMSEIEEASIDQLAPLLQDEDTKIASRAIRVASLWRATSLRASLTEAISRPDSAGLEAAWASARLFGPEMIDTIRQRGEASQDYDERVEFACLLTLLGEDQWAATILDDARGLLAVQQLRGRSIKPVEQLYDPSQARFGGDVYIDDWHYRRGSSTQFETIIDGRLSNTATWEGLLAVVMDAPAEADLSSRLDLAPAASRNTHQTEDLKLLQAGHPLVLRHDLENGLAFVDGVTNNLPIPELVGSDSPSFISLEMHEAELFDVSLTMRSRAGMTGQELDADWNRWLASHGNDDIDTRWRAGVASAIQSLTDAKWWRRSLARERLQRLTGQTIEQPVLFDNEQWASLQKQWQAWADTEQAKSWYAALSAVAVEAGLIETAPANDAEELAMLVEMAGWGSGEQSIAALQRLNFWSDTDALLRATESWQASPRSHLRNWYLQHATDTPRIYVSADELD